MRLLKTLLATVVVLALTGTAFANTRDERTGTMGGTSHLSAGGKLNMVISRKPKGKFFHVVVRYDVFVKSATVLDFTAYPCKNTNCIRPSTNTISLARGVRHLTFTGRVPVNETASGQECVFIQVRDRGPNNRKPGKIVRRHGHPGMRVCHG
jgi:hypothetical protein